MKPIRPHHESRVAHVCIRAGDVRIHIVSRCAHLIAGIRQRWTLFWELPRARPMASRRGIRLLYRCSGHVPDHLPSRMADYHEPHRVQWTRSGFHVYGRTFRGYADLTRKKVYAYGPCAWYPIDRMLRYLWPLCLRYALVLHGGLFVIRGEGWIVTGPSGSGKTTLMRLLGPWSVCDEMVALWQSLHGWRVMSLPVDHARPGQAPVQGILRLRHGTRHTCRVLAPAAALRVLIPQVRWVTRGPRWFNRQMNELFQLVQHIPVMNFSFRPTPDVRDFILQEVIRDSVWVSRSDRTGCRKGHPAGCADRIDQPL